MTTEDLTSTVVGLDDPIAKDVSKVGGKVAGLAAFVGVLPVPRGYAVTVDGLDPLGLTTKAYNELYTKLLYTEGDDFFPVAVRSSAVDEDGEKTSFAGQHETILDVPNWNRVAYAVDRCSSSFYGERALSYRKQLGLSDRLADIKGAILIQTMVPADWSAVAFGKNPANGSTDEIVINMAPGLGERIVAGTCLPLSYVYGKDGKIRSFDMGEFEGTKVPDGHPQRIVSAVNQIEQLWGGRPVDLECSFIDNDFYLLQARPVTI